MTTYPKPSVRSMIITNLLTALALGSLGVLIGGFWGGVLFFFAIPPFILAILVFLVRAWEEAEK